MPLLQGDIQIARSAVMADTDNGGGPPSKELLPDGASNAIVPDISEDARVGGLVEIRHLHGVLRNPGVEQLGGANVILAEPPDDPYTSVTLVATGNTHARRPDIVKLIEATSTPGPEFPGFLLENHVAAQRSIQIAQRPGVEPPGVNTTLYLVENEGKATQKEQYVRVRRVTTELTVFTEADPSGGYKDFPLQVATCELFSPLRSDFTGTSATRMYAADKNATRVRRVTVMDAGSFFSAARLTAPCAAEDIEVKVASIYTQLVPNTRTETPLTDQRPSGQRTLTLTDSYGELEITAACHTQRLMISEATQGYAHTFKLQPLPAPGTLTISYLVMGSWLTITDDGEGALTGSGGGTVNYATGSVAVTLQALPDYNSPIICSWADTAGYTNRAGGITTAQPPEWSWELDTESETERIVPGTLTLQWEAGGDVKSATDDGFGVLEGDAAGTVDYFSRIIFFKPVVMPDAGAEVLATCQTQEAREELLAVGGPDAGGFAILTLAEQPAAGSVMVQWASVNTVSNTSGANHTWAQTLKSEISFTDMKTVSTRPVARKRHAWTRGAERGPIETVMVGNSSDKQTVYETHCSSQSGSKYSFSSALSDEGQVIQNHTVTDDGAGNLFGTFGAVDYDARRIQIRLQDRSTSTSSYNSDHEDSSAFAVSNIYVNSTTATPGPSGGTASGGGTSIGVGNTGSNSAKGGQYSTAKVERGILAGNSVRVTYSVGTAAPRSHSSSHALGTVALDLLPLTSDTILTGSVRFTWMGQTYTDFEGVLYAGRTASNPGVPSGNLDYEAGIATMADWTGGAAAAAPVLQRCWTRRAKWNSAIIHGRTSTCPVRPGGLTLTATALDGESITATVNEQGVIEGDEAWGAMDFATGYFQIMFGHFARPDSLSEAQKAEWWYDPADIGSAADGHVWVPRPVDPMSLRYNAVTYTYLPIDGELLGMTAERLPPDGRMPFVRAGDYCVIGRTIWGAAFTPSVGMTYNVGAQRLSSVDILDAGDDGGQVETGWNVDLDAGTVTITDTTGWPAQVIVRGRIEVYRRVAEVSVDGTVRLTMPVGHAFAEGDVLSTAVRYGNKYAHVLRMFDQQSWDGVTYKDSRTGNEAVGNYDNINYPVSVNNRGTITEKWALRFRSNARDFDLIGEHLGQIAAGNIGEDFSPQNHNAGTPYFTIKAAGWGAGWTAGNTLFIHTIGAEMPFAFVRSISPGPATQPEWRCLLAVRGSVDRPPSTPYGGN